MPHGFQTSGMKYVPGSRKGANHTVTFLQRRHSAANLNNLAHELVAHDVSRRTRLNATVCMQVTGSGQRENLIDSIMETLTCHRVPYIPPSQRHPQDPVPWE